MSMSKPKDKNFSDIMFQIGKESFERLESIGIPPYPKYYQEMFMDILEEIDDTKLISYVNKYKYLFEPERKEELIADTCYTIAQESIEEFSQTHENIRHISEKGMVDLNEISKDIQKIDTSYLFSLFASFQKELENELHKSNEIIEKLKEEMELLEKESNIDPLTKTFNKRAFLKDLNEILKFGKDKELDLNLLFIDIDDFTYTNQTYGYIAGDKILIYLTKLLTNSLRRGVKVYRYEGECFAIILNRTQQEDAYFVAKRILHDTQESNLYYKGNNIKLTVSIGIAKHHQNDDFNAIIKRAFDALKIAKAKGKNRIEEG